MDYDIIIHRRPKSINDALIVKCKFTGIYLLDIPLTSDTVYQLTKVVNEIHDKNK